MSSTQAEGRRAPALVTGAGSGLGLRLAELLATRGHSILCLDVRLDETPRARLQAAADVGGGQVAFAEADVRDGAAVQAAVATLVEQAGAPRLVVNSAGVIHARPFLELDEDAFRRVVDINLIGSRNVAAATLPHLTGGGHLVLIASLAGLFGNYAYSAYNASKFGVVGLAEALRIEGAETGTRVSVVCPPEVETPMVTGERETMLPQTAALKALAGTLPLETAARQILAGIDAGGFMIVPGRRARLMRASGKYGPARLTHWLTDRTVARFKRA